MVIAFAQSLRPGRSGNPNVTEEEVASFVSDMLRQLCMLIDPAALPSQQKVKIRQAIELIEVAIKKDGWQQQPKF
jgi:hypothetical protein